MCLLYTGKNADPARVGAGKAEARKTVEACGAIWNGGFPSPKSVSNVAKESRAGTGRLSVSPALVARLSLTATVFAKLRNAVSTTGEAGFFSNQPLFSAIQFIKNFNLFLTIF